MSSAATSWSSRNAEIRPISSIARRVSVLAILRKPRLEIAQDGILGVSTHADDIGKAELVAIGVVDALERRVFGIRQPVEAGAVLLVGQFRGEPRRALGFVGEIRMRADQRQLHVGFGARSTAHHRGVQLVDAGEGSLRREFPGDPRRIFNNIGERGNEIGFIGGIEIGQRDLRHRPHPISNASAARCAMLVVPMLGDLQPRGHPDALVLADVIEEADQPRRAAGRPARRQCRPTDIIFGALSPSA